MIANSILISKNKVPKHLEKYFEPAACGECHMCKLVAGFRELRRILRDDGTLWLNYGDKYIGGGCGSGYGGKQDTNRGSSGCITARGLNLPSGNLIGLAWRLALALQADGWILRDDIIWAKAVSFCPTYSGSTMPESVNGWRWERCRKRTWPDADVATTPDLRRDKQQGRNFGNPVVVDCPGCKKCEPNGGYVLRKGSWRPTRAHEYVFQFAKTNNYFCDAEAVKEGSTCERIRGTADYQHVPNGGNNNGLAHGDFATRNLRDVWTQEMDLLQQFFEWRASQPNNTKDTWCINPQPWSRAHYATFPEALVEPIIKVATSQKGVCPKCGSPWARIVKTEYKIHENWFGGKQSQRHDRGEQGNSYKEPISSATLGWRATCGCGIEETHPSVVYDPFMGSGTVGAVAARLGRNYSGSELNEEYLKQQAKLRIAASEHGMSIEEVEAGQQGLFMQGS